MLTGFTASLLLITLSELGDKTFLIAMILSMRHPHRLVFSSVVSALTLMTLISVLLGQALSFLPPIYTRYGAIALFLIFGVKLIYDALQMSDESESEGAKEVEEALEKPVFGSHLGPWFQGFFMTFLGEWGDRTQISTIALAAAHNPIAITLGAILGYAICTFIAIRSGQWIAGRLSERMMMGIGGGLFLIFALTLLIGNG